MQYPVVDIRVRLHEAQSESLNAFSCMFDLLGKKIPRAGDALMYLGIRLIALWWWAFGDCM